MKIEIAKCERQEDEILSFVVSGTVDGDAFVVSVIPSSSEYDYHIFPSALEDDDEPLQIAIGQYFEENNIDIGRVGR